MGAIVAFLFLICGVFLVGPCGPGSPIVYVLIPGLLLNEWTGGDFVPILLIQLALGASFGVIIARLWQATASHRGADPRYQKCDCCGREMFAKFVEAGICTDCRKRMGIPPFELRDRERKTP